MRVLITGGQGFIGRNLLKYFRSLGWETEPLKANIVKYDRVLAEMREFRPEVVIHCAAVVSSILCDLAGGYSFDVNVKGTWNVAKISKDLGADFIYVGSSASYKPSEEVITEESPLEPKTLYGFTKYLGEEVTRHVMGDDYTIVRLVFVFGPFDGHSGVWRIISAGLQRRPVILLMDPRKYKDYMFVDNVNTAFERIVRKRLRGVYNVSYGKPQRLSEVVQKTLEIMRKHGVPPPLDIVFRPEEDYLGSHVVSNQKFIKASGWRPEVSFEEGVEICVKTGLKWFRPG